jgi:hypothetical protein
MTDKMPLYESPGEKGKRGFEDLECYQLALEVMAKIHVFAETLPPKEKYDPFPSDDENMEESTNQTE